MINPKFNEAKERLITAAQRVAGAYLLSKYGSAHLHGEPKVEVTATEGPTSSSFVFSGAITCYASDGILNQVGVNMTVNENDISVTSEDIQANISEALNAAEEHTDKVVASLDGFSLTDDGTNYLKVAHKDFQDSKLGVVGKNEYATSKDRAALLQGMFKDAVLNTPVEFTGEFKEPTIVKAAIEVAPAIKREAALEEVKPQPKKSSWLTADLEVPTLDENGNVILAEVDETKEVSKIAITEDVPLARAADMLVQEKQSEEQSMLEAQMKVEHEAANQLMSLLQGMGYGSAKTVEITSSKEGLDIMTAIDDGGAVKAVSIPVAVKEGKVVLPKKALVATLVSKGLDIKAKLAEQFDLEVLEKLAAIEERIAYEAAEAEAILAERPVSKQANEGKNTMFEGDTDTLTVQKHLLPNHEDLKVGDRVSDGSDQWEIVNQGGQQNSKGEGDSSLWTMKKVQGPERDDKEPKNKMPI